MTTGKRPRVKNNTQTSVYRVCFVCTGNICRSPMADSVLRSRVRDAGLEALVAVDSAGTGDWHVGDPADPRTVRVLAAHGYASRHTARQFRPGEFAARDLVIALDHGHLRTLRRWKGQWEASGEGVGAAGAELRLLREFDPEAPGDRWDVPDPYYGSLAGFEECLAMVESAMPGLLLHIATELETRTL
jgi:low molecular weight protein-tyrosine phosphatase